MKTEKVFFAALLCGLIMFSAGVAAEEEYWITIDPIPDQMLGTTYIISGETNLPAGSKLLFEHYWADWECHDTRVCCKPKNSGEISYVTQVQQGTGDTNLWSTVMNTSEFGYVRKFLAKINSLDTPARISTTYNLLEPTPETPWVIINPILNQHRGTTVTITGSVFQPQKGRLLITIQPVWFDHNTAPDTVEPLPFVKQILVTVPEEPTDYQWNISLDTTTFPPDMYRVEASGIDYDLVTQNQTFLLFGNGNSDDYTIVIIAKEEAPVAGLPFTVQGSTDTQNRTTLVYELVPKGLYTSLAEIRTGYIRTTPARVYSKIVDTANIWEVTIDTAGLKAGNYTLKISALDAPVTAVTEIELLNERAMQITKKTSGFGILVIAFTIAVIYGALRKK